MSGNRSGSSDPGAWFIETNRVSLTALTQQRARARMEDAQHRSSRVVIVSSLFMVLLGAGLLVGGHAAIDPIVQSAVEAREAQTIGSIVYTMPDGIFCRRISFDNATAQITESAIERCRGDIANQRRAAAHGFIWGTN